MHVKYLASTKPDLIWYRRYYTKVFPEGRDRAGERYLSIVKSLAVNPYLGKPSEEHPNLRELAIPRTPFTLVYRVAETQIEILRLKDERSGQ